MAIVMRPGAGEGGSAKGKTLVVVNWPAPATATAEVAPLHVHYADDEAWHVIEGALHFRFAHGESITAEAGTTVVVPAGTPHTFGNAGPGPCRYLLVLPSRLDELIGELHRTAADERHAVYQRYESELLE